MEAIEELVLQDSGRGMDRLAPHMSGDYCAEAARQILSWNRGTVLLTTGFLINGIPETDGPAGAIVLSNALATLGFDVVLLAEEKCCKVLAPLGQNCVPVALDATEADLQQLLDRYCPVGLISIERCGRNDQGRYLNMRGQSVGENTAPIDGLFQLAKGTVPIIAVGDGGNEIGMGSVIDAIVAEQLPISPCVVQADVLVIATVSNWGAYAVTAYLQLQSGQALLPAAQDVDALMEKIAAAGCIDGVLQKIGPTVDGFEPGREAKVVGQLNMLLQRLAA